MINKLYMILLISFALLSAGSATAKDKKDNTNKNSDESAAATAKPPSETTPSEATESPTDEDSAAPQNPSTQDKVDNRLTAVHSRMTLKVINPDTARDELKKIAVSLGGYATQISDASIILKLPPEQLNSAIDTFADQGILVEKTIERKDLTLEIAQLEGKLNSQNEILTKLRSFFDDSDFAATLNIERSMSRLVMEIEEVKGRLRYLYDQAKWAVVEVDFRFRERESVIYVSSPFEWLNSANLSTFLEEF